VVALGRAETDHIADIGTARSSASILTPQSPAESCAMLEPWRLQEHHCVASAAQRPGCCTASLHCSPEEAEDGRCSPRASDHILEVRLEAAFAVAVGLAGQSEGRRAVVGAEGYRFDRIARRSDSTLLVDRTQFEDIRPGIPETKRQKTLLPAEVSAL
jgi:hypothetical protein